MQKQWIERNIIFLDCIAAKFIQSVKSSLVGRKLAITEVDETLLPKFKINKEKQTT